MRRWTGFLIGLLPLAAIACEFRLQSETRAEHTASCFAERVIDGDTFVCGDDTRVRLLQISAPELDDPGGEWSKAGLRFFIEGRTVSLEYDEVTQDRFSRHLAAPHVIGTDGKDYNISILMVYVGLARAAYYGDNEKLLGWAEAAETWARTACWNMWSASGPWAGESGCR